jgi:predicted transposase YbfD/YdcC
VQAHVVICLNQSPALSQSKDADVLKKKKSLTLKQIKVVVEELARGLVDPRAARGRRYPLEVMLLLSIGGVAFGANNPEEIARFASSQKGKDITRKIRKRDSSPVRTTIRDFLGRVGFESLLGKTWEILKRRYPKTKMMAIAVDGKAINAAHRDGERPPVLVSVATHALGVVLTQQQVDSKSNEISVFISLLEPLSIDGWIITTDAIQTQSKNAEFIVTKKRAQYLFPVKENQPSLLRAIEDESLISGKPSAEFTDKGHGRFEVRRLWSSEVPSHIASMFPHVKQILTVERERTKLGGKEVTSTEVAHFVTSLSPKDASGETLLSLIRGHWSIENRVHYCLDVAFDEDRCRTRIGNLPAVLSALKKIVMNIFRLHGVSGITRERQLHAWSC